MLKLKYLIQPFLLILCLSACAGFGVSKADKELRLRERCDGFIAARIKHDKPALKQFYRDPDAAKLGQVMYKSTEIVSLKVADDGLRAATGLESEVMAMTFSFKGLKETINWVWQDKEWFIVPAEASPGPFPSNKK